MSKINVEKAIRYNEGRGYNVESIKEIQNVIGAPQTGTFDERTVERVASFQCVHDLDVDGMVGPKTKDKIDELKPCYTDPVIKGDYEIGMWWDVGSKDSVTNADRFVSEMKDLGISNVALMMTGASNSDAPKWKWSMGRFEIFTEALRKGGINISLTFWPRPRRAYLDELFAKLPEYIEVAKPTMIEVDVEGNWTSKGVEGFGSFKEAGDYLVAQMKAWKAKYGVRLGATTYLYHGEHSPGKAVVSPYMDYLTPQAYSRYDGGDEDRAWGAPLGPGGFQEAAFKRAGRIEGPEIEMGLAAWDQSGFPDHTAQEAMAKAFETAIGLGVKRVWYWSAKWIVGGHETSYGKAFLKTLH